MSPLLLSLSPLSCHSCTQSLHYESPPLPSTRNSLCFASFFLPSPLHPVQAATGRQRESALMHFYVQRGNWRERKLKGGSFTRLAITHTTHTHTRTHRWKSVYNTHIALSREKNTHTKKTKTKSKQSIRTLSSPNMERGM